MKEEINLREIQKAEFDIFLNISKILEELNLNYYLCFGSLLGGVRHKGFIPWDDDMDIAMPREDYKKLIEWSKENNNKISENLFLQGLELDNGIYQFLKVINTDYEVEQDVGLDKYLWVDIFPLDGLPEDIKEQKKVIKKMYINHHLYAIKLLKIKNILNDRDKSLSNKIIKITLKCCLFFITKKRLISETKKLSREYPYKDSKYVTCMVSLDNEKQIYKKEWFVPEKIEFEGNMVNGIKYYDELLKVVYGNYMKLPDEKNRTTHGMKVYYVGK